MLIAWLSVCLASSVDVKIELVGATLSEGTRVRIEYTLWQLRELYARRLGIQYPDDMDLHVTIHGDRDSFRAAADAAGQPSWSGGWFEYSAEGRHRATLLAGNEQRLIEVFLHEGSHFLVVFGGVVPRWLNEGLAMAVEASRTEGRNLIVSTNAFHRRLLAQHGAGDLQAMVLDATAWKDVPREEATARYARAWAVAVVLMSTTNGADTMLAIAQDHRRTGDPRTALRAIERVYRGGVAGLQRDVDAFVKDLPDEVTVATTLKGPLNSDAMWTNCPDGRLVRTDIGCGY